MSLFSSDSSIQEINKILIRELSGNIRIIGDIELSSEDFEILKSRLRLTLRADFKTNANYYGESLCVFLVYCAQMFFDEHGFWLYVEDLLMKISFVQRHDIRKQFITTCKFYGFNDFENERISGHAIITPIICHAGISNSNLDSFFEILKDAVSDVEFAGELNLSEGIFDYFLIHMAPIYIKRYLNSLDEERDSFLLQWYDVIHSFYNELSTAESLTAELLSLYKSETDTIIPFRYLAHYCDWKRRPVITAEKNKAKRASFKSPQIFLNTDCLGIFIRLPQQRLISEYKPRRITWLIKSDDAISIIECQAFVDGADDHFVTEEIESLLKPAKMYSFELYDDVDQNEPIAHWNIDLGNRIFLAFTSRGDLIKSDTVNANQGIFVIEEQWKIEGKAYFAELTKIPYWGRFNIVSYSAVINTTLSISDRKTGKLVQSISIAPFEKPELVGGELLWNNPGVYFKLPRIRLPRINNSKWHGTLILPSGRYEFDQNESEQNDIVLAESIKPEAFGTYELRIRNGAENRYQIRFHYVPELKLVSDTSKWPVPKDGYHSDKIQIQLPQGIDIKLNQLIQDFDAIHGQDHRVVFSCLNNINKVNGKIIVSNSSPDISCPVQISLRPILWSVLGGVNDKLVLTDKPIRQDYSTLLKNSEQFLFISTGDIGADTLDGKLIGRRADGTVLLEREIEVKAWHQFKWDYSDLLLSADTGESKRFTIFLELFAPDGPTIGSWPIMIVNNPVKINDLVKEKLENGIKISWRESGNKLDRVLIIQNLFEPWSDSIIFPIDDNMEKIVLSASDVVRGLYCFKIDATPEWSPFGQTDYSPARIDLKNIISFGLVPPLPSRIISINVKSLEFLLTAKTNELELPALSLSTEAEIDQLAKSFLFLKSNQELFNPVKFNKVISIYKSIGKKTAISPESLLRFLLSRFRAINQLNLLQEFFGLAVIPGISGKPFFRNHEISLLANNNPTCAFQISLSQGDNVEWIIRWIGEGDLHHILSIDPDQLSSYISDRMSEHPSNETLWTIPDGYWGSIEDSIKFSQYVRALKPSEIYANNDDLIKAYEHKNKLDEYRLFGKTYLAALQELQDAHVKFAEDFRKFEDFYEKAIKPQNIHSSKLYPGVHDKLLRRVDRYEDNPLEDLAYKIGITVLDSVMYRRGEWALPDYGLMRQIARLRSIIPGFYRRDLVLIEMYILGGGK